MRVSIYQPQYFPRLHYLNRVLDADVFVLLASAQYTKSLVHVLDDGRRERRKSYQSHAPIKQHDGEHLLTVPITAGSKRDGVDEVRPADDHGWRSRHRNTIKAAYGRAPCFDARFPEVVALLDLPVETLAELNEKTLLWALDVLLGLGIGVERLDLQAVNDGLERGDRDVRLRRIVRDRDTGVQRPEGEQMGGPWTAALCAAVGGDEYVFGGTAGAGYMAVDDYVRHGIRLVQQDWRGRTYAQQFDDRTGFLANLSVLDLLFNVEPAEALQIVCPATEAARVSSASGVAP